MTHVSFIDHTLTVCNLLQLLARFILQLSRPSCPSDMRGRFWDCDASLALCRVRFASHAVAAPFLDVPETEGDLLNKFIRALAGRTVTPAHPALYHIAIHNIACVLFGAHVLSGGVGDNAVGGPWYAQWWSSAAGTLRADIAAVCLRALDDQAYGDVLRYTYHPSSSSTTTTTTLPSFPLESDVAIDPARIAILKELAEAAGAMMFFSRRHS